MQRAPARVPSAVPAPREEAMDDGYMRRALELAERGRGLVSPNPLVGAVLVADGQVVGEGWHEGPGTPHAEARALDAAGPRARGGTLYTTLEPCSHQGRTPPCAPRVIQAGIRRVVTAIGDPNPLVDGGGFAALRAAGIAVEIGRLGEQVTRQNEAFLKHVRTGLPFVTLKMAATLDGKVAARDGSSRWITGEAAREQVHGMRAEADAVMVGAGTALRDDPALTVRLPGYRGRPKLRILVDGRGVTPETKRLFIDGEAPTLVATSEAAPASRRRAWTAAGADLLVVGDPGDDHVRLDRLFEELGKRDVQHVLLEGGPTLAWESVRQGVVDKVVLFLAPKLLGGAGAPGVLMGAGSPTLDEALPLDVADVEPVGSDLKVTAYVHRDR
jgi:diaminohydroxyphosphoribosylaminopyrimidine deaminase/5-amino-6-(5-phosphoribosylamino)uracil reductase